MEKQYLPSYYVRHAEELRAKSKEYYQNNKDAVLERRKAKGYKKFICEACNKEILLSNKTNHIRSDKHKLNVQNANKKKCFFGFSNRLIHHNFNLIEILIIRLKLDFIIVVVGFIIVHVLDSLFTTFNSCKTKPINSSNNH